VDEGASCTIWKGDADVWSVCGDAVLLLDIGLLIGVDEPTEVLERPITARSYVLHPGAYTGKCSSLQEWRDR
jgi:hypothetical protein